MRRAWCLWRAWLGGGGGCGVGILWEMGERGFEGGKGIGPDQTGRWGEHVCIWETGEDCYLVLGG